MKIKLTTNRIIQINAIHIMETYAGVLYGNYTPEINLDIAYSIKYPQELWGKREVFHIRPSQELIQNKLPDYEVSILCDSTPTIFAKQEDQYDGSELVITFFTDISIDISMKKLLDNHISSVNWDEMARNYFF